MQEDFPYDATPNLLNHLSVNQYPASRSRISWKDHVLRFGDASTGKRWHGVLASLAIVGLITILGFRIETIIRSSNFAVLYMLAVIFSALRWGRRAAILSAVSGALSFTFFFVPPYRSFAVSDIWYLITLIGLLTVGLVISMLTVAAREDANLARRREAHTAALYSFTESLASGNKFDQILDSVARHFLRGISTTHCGFIARRRKSDGTLSQRRFGLRRM